VTFRVVRFTVLLFTGVGMAESVWQVMQETPAGRCAEADQRWNTTGVG